MTTFYEDGDNTEQSYLELENEKLKLENEKLKKQLEEGDNYDPQFKKDMEQFVQIASQMRELLMKCRNERINIDLAKQIDYVLDEASKLDN